MSIANMAVKADGAEWGADGRAAFDAIKTFAYGGFLCEAQSDARPTTWPGPLIWICTYGDPSTSPPTNMLDLDIAIPGA